jgi:predicted naringenin-chalcone synthase
MNTSGQDKSIFVYICRMGSFINAISTTVPPFRYSQPDILNFMIRTLSLNDVEAGRLGSIYRSSGIATRYSVLEDFSREPGRYDFFPPNPGLEPFPSTSVRMKKYKENALPLAVGAAEQLISAGMDKSKITHLIVTSCTGMYAPGLDIGLVDALGLAGHTRRTGINFMGCYAAITALRMADSICEASPDAQVLLVCLELCTLHFQKENSDKNLVVNSLFSDGCAAAWVSSSAAGKPSLQLEAFYSGLAFDAGSSMTWDIADTGFEMALTHEVPQAIKNGIGKLTDNLFRQSAIRKEDIGFYAIHPGGRKILEVIEEALDMDTDQNRFAYTVLRDFGNMSSPTVLFVLQEILRSLAEASDGKHILSFAFGPGLTMESMLLKIRY